MVGVVGPIGSQSPSNHCSGLRGGAEIAQLGSHSPFPHAHSNSYPIMPQASGKALLVVLSGMILDDRDI